MTAAYFRGNEFASSMTQHSNLIHEANILQHQSSQTMLSLLVICLEDKRPSNCQETSGKRNETISFVKNFRRPWPIVFEATLAGSRTYFGLAQATSIWTKNNDTWTNAGVASRSDHSSQPRSLVTTRTFVNLRASRQSLRSLQFLPACVDSCSIESSNRRSDIHDQ